jgi:hypothetical protein
MLCNEETIPIGINRASLQETTILTFLVLSYPQKSDIFRVLNKLDNNNSVQINSLFMYELSPTVTGQLQFPHKYGQQQ